MPDRDRVNLALHFPEAGVTAGGSVFRFGPGGKVDPRPEDGVSAATLAMVDAAVHRTKKGMSLEVAFPARALPRFPARDALVLGYGSLTPRRIGTSGQSDRDF